MKEFIKPEMEIVVFTADEIIATSYCEFDCNPDKGDGPCERVCAGVCVYNACSSNSL